MACDGDEARQQGNGSCRVGSDSGEVCSSLGAEERQLAKYSRRTAVENKKEEESQHRQFSTEESESLALCKAGQRKALRRRQIWWRERHPRLYWALGQAGLVSAGLGWASLAMDRPEG